MVTTLPAVPKGSVEVARLTTGICAAIADIFLPGAGVLGPIAQFAIDKFVKGPEKILMEELRRGEIRILDEEHAAAFVPMAYKFFEAEKEGEYEHNLRILADLIAHKMQSATPDVPSFARAARRIESLEVADLRVMAMIGAIVSTGSDSPTIPKLYADRVFVSATQLAANPLNTDQINRARIQDILSDLSGRGLLIVDGATRFNKMEESYSPSASFDEILIVAKRLLDSQPSADSASAVGPTVG
jgi:hypothetical protein